ncbi:hypothetical protein [Virgibacillus halodenitrificans]|uniref:hypothetical protein n=1 Tax=Virgibacillus halodenitrificans TaxID=1482 RepID=UPI001CB8EBF6|nr:hypothetical protein [Virgibacillus halodenitrificans]
MSSAHAIPGSRGPTGQGKLLRETSHAEKAGFFFKDVGYAIVATMGFGGASMRSPSPRTWLS